MALQSKLFRGDSKLEAAAVSDPAHIMQGARGPHVVKIQQALVQVDGASIETDGAYGRATAAAVSAFKTKRRILNYQGQIDNIVGKKTIAALDEEMRVKESGRGGGLKLRGGGGFLPGLLLLGGPSFDVEEDTYKLGSDDPKLSPDKGAGPFASVTPTSWDKVKREAIVKYLPPDKSGDLILGPDAAKHLKHYFDATGRDYVINLPGMLRDCKSARDAVREEVEGAKRFVEKQSIGVHFIVSKRVRSAEVTGAENKNWCFAVSQYNRWGKGRATVRPGLAGQECQLDFEYKFFDRYNFDEGRKFTLAGFEWDDETMGRFHVTGLAQEFNSIGSVKTTFTWVAGKEIPKTQWRFLGG